MKKLLILLLIILSASVIAQDRSRFLYAEVADQSVTLYPFYKPFGSNFDPAVTLGAGIDYRQKENSAFFQVAQLTMYSTMVTGNGLNLTTSVGYRYYRSSGIFAETQIGLGASFFYPSRQTFVQDENGTYVPAIPLHVMPSVPIDLLLGYSIGKYSFYLKYRYMIQGPYTGAMPVLPTSLAGIGIRYNIQAAID